MQNAFIDTNPTHANGMPHPVPDTIFWYEGAVPMLASRDTNGSGQAGTGQNGAQSGWNGSGQNGHGWGGGLH